VGASGAREPLTNVTGLAALAWADGVVTPLERHDLDEVAALLGLSNLYVEQALAAGAEMPSSAGKAFCLVAGDRVVFTGDMQLPRAQWTARAEQAGLVVGGVTKSTKVVVAADPDSLSGKAGKARARGIPVVTEEAFARLLSEMGRTVTARADHSSSSSVRRAETPEAVAHVVDKDVVDPGSQPACVRNERPAQ
jgi:BRCT domain type II-containing protein